RIGLVDDLSACRHQPQSTVEKGRGMAEGVRLLLRGALVIFVITVVIGILNGLAVWNVPHLTLLPPVHPGPLAWITPGVFGAARWSSPPSRCSSGSSTGSTSGTSPTTHAAPPCPRARWVGSRSESSGRRGPC